MAETSNRVETIFEIVDKASAPIRKITEASQKLTAAVEKSQKATSGTTSAPGGPADQGVASAGAKKNAAVREKSAKDEAKAGKNLARQRLIAHHQAMRPTVAAAHIASAGLHSLGLHSTELGGRLMKVGHMAFIAGDELSKLGGKAGKVGHVIGKVGASAGAAIAAFEIAYGAASKLNDWINANDDRIDAMKNEITVMQWGYRSVKAYTFVVDEAGKTQRALTLRAQTLARLLPSIPVGATAKVMEEWNLKARRMITEMGGDLNIEEMQKMLGLLTNASRTTAVGLAKSASQRVQYNKFLETRTKELGALRENAGLAERNRYLFSVAKVAEANAELYGVTKEVAMQDLLASAERRGSVANVNQAYLEQATVTYDLNKSVARQVKILQTKMPLEQLVKGSVQASELIVAAADMEAERVGRGGDPEFRKMLLSKIGRGLERKRTSFDFRNSRFQIEQKFAKGFDPDRIAVAFASDVASLGEKKLRSNLGPVFGGG